MDSYVRTHLLPYDFGLTPEQEAELFQAVRTELDNTGDEELFSAILRFKVEEIADRKIRHWREQVHLADEVHRLKEIRSAAPDYAPAFLTAQATPAAIEQLKARFGIENSEALQAELIQRVKDWIATVDDAELTGYNVLSVKDLVFAQLRSWC
jgi:hypothetical protein